jgi:hypothetical protein
LEYERQTWQLVCEKVAADSAVEETHSGLSLEA